MKKSHLILGLILLSFILMFSMFFANYPVFLPSVTTPPSVSMLPTMIEISERRDATTLIVHGTTENDTTCAVCHIEPIIVNCTICHPAPPMYINETTFFPHHDPLGYPQYPDGHGPDGPYDLPCHVCHSMHGGPDFPSCGSAMCHDTEDARYIYVLEGNYDYCRGCHYEQKQSPSP